MKKLVLFLLFSVLAINLHSQPYALKSTEIGIIGDKFIFKEINYFEFDTTTIVWYNHNSKVKATFTIYKIQTVYDSELDAEITIYDVWNENTRKPARITAVILVSDQEIHLMLGNLIFYNLTVIDL